ncbi:DUF2829 domain-containing protein [Latilactobacillus sakei]|uniref:DUF2829 domain-containing protein n=1 Tax=Latilactobacillus sakei TaxID=1599 RepID=UPI002072A877|nr:DUF2829 domain-containing protein [Latilactobacillus sakei]
MDFGQAIKQLKQGNKVARKGWNGKGVWLVFMPSLYLEADKMNERTVKHIGRDTPVDCQPYIVMWTAEQKWQPGWLASQSDMLVEDWQVVSD